MGPTSRIVISQVWYEFRQQGLKCNLQKFSNGRLMEFILQINHAYRPLVDPQQPLLSQIHFHNISLFFLFFLDSFSLSFLTSFLPRQIPLFQSVLFSTPLGLPSHTTGRYTLPAILFSTPVGQHLKLVFYHRILSQYFHSLQIFDK